MDVGWGVGMDGCGYGDVIRMLVGDLLLWLEIGQDVEVEGGFARN